MCNFLHYAIIIQNCVGGSSMNITTKEVIKKEIEQFHKETIRFLNKELSVKEYKGYSGAFGAYAQRGASSFMLRLRLGQGIITKDHVKFTADICKKHNITKAHFTTCQTIQLHDLKGLEIADIMLEALDHDIVCRGGGGDYPRNVMCSPLSGVEQGEHFDVIPYAQAVSSYLLEAIHTYKLPRKLKIGFSNSDKNESHATFRDLGFSANSDQTFDVYCAGGLGNNPKLGVCVAKNIKPNQVLSYVKAMIEVFKEHGNYENRAKARTRYLQDTLGIDGLIEAFQTSVARIQEHEQLTCTIQPQNIQKTGATSPIQHRRITAQKQIGLYAVYYHPLGGCFHPTKLQELYELLAPMQDVELRITPQQGVYIINCNYEEAQQILAHTEDGAQSEFEESVACIGSSTCQVGLRDSQSVLHQIITQLRPYNFADHVLPKVFISGCPSSCGTNQIGILGFQGSVKVIDKQPLSAFTLSVHGNDTQSKARFGTVLGVVLERDILAFLTDIAQAVTKQQTTFVAWLTQYEQQFMDIVQTYIK